MPTTLTDQAIAQLAVELEPDRVERKESLSGGTTKDRVAQAICAFSDDLPNYQTPGLVLVEVTDAGIPTGHPVTDKLLLA